MVKILGSYYETIIKNIWDQYLSQNGKSCSPIKWTCSNSSIHYNIKETNVFPGIAGPVPLSNFVIPRKIKQNTILFIGLNPSVISYKQERKNVPYLFNADLQFEDIYKSASFASGSPQYHLGGVADIDYFEKINKLCKEINKPTTIYEKFSYLDLFQVRVTADDAIKWALEHHSEKDKDGTILHSGLTAFLQGQLDLCCDLIKQVNPTVIVVNNATASKFILNKEERNGLESPLADPTYDRRIGTYKVKVNGNAIPIFFTRMMSSGGLDDGSFNRLAWHIRNVFKMSNNSQPMNFT